MAFKKGNEIGKDTRFSAKKQPKKNGRPKNLVSAILETLKKDGELVTRSLVEQTYQILLSLTQGQLTKIATDTKQPMINRIVAKEMLGKKGFEIIEKMMDRANGKPTQVQDITQETKNEIVKVYFNIEGQGKLPTNENELFDDD